jgi:uncharacterized membrane protein
VLGREEKQSLQIEFGAIEAEDSNANAIGEATNLCGKSGYFRDDEGPSSPKN